MASEREYLEAIASVFSSSHHALLVGIGDDAAVVAKPQAPIALSTDMAIEGTHFTREWSSLFEIGAKITAANLADIYAMGGRPTYLLVAAGIPENYSVEDVRELAMGIADEAKKVGAVVVGGDLARSRDLIISISVYGEVITPLLRSGAKVGDVVAVSQIPGESAYGLSLLQNGVHDERTAAHRRPQVDYVKISAINPDATHALSDISDGLISELGHISEASGVGISIDSNLLFAGSEESHKSFILHGGEDHHFVGTFPDEIPDGWIAIGKVISGNGVSVDGQSSHHEGFSHFA
jgi:thiamine-monophosphate kinase